jgi:tRNA-dihydrouridine synthase A
MMDRTDRHFRFFLRQISQHTLLYTEMVTTGALIHGDQPQHLDFSPLEHPISLQLGGDDARELAHCAKLGEDWGYDEINLNVGCPSERVQNGSFGACLMAEPEKVAAAVIAMRDVVSIPVTVKHRIGIDDLDRYEDMERFVSVVAQAGCDRFSVHARKAWLKGLSPKENRTVPPLRYEDVYRLKKTFPHLVIEINGGFTNLQDIEAQIPHVDAVMVGRAAYDNPYFLADVDGTLFGDPRTIPTRHEAVESMFGYIEEMGSGGHKLHNIVRHLHHLFHGCPGARAWKRALGERCVSADATLDDLRYALQQVPAVG